MTESGGRGWRQLHVQRRKSGFDTRLSSPDMAAVAREPSSKCWAGQLLQSSEQRPLLAPQGGNQLAERPLK